MWSCWHGVGFLSNIPVEWMGALMPEKDQFGAERQRDYLINLSVFSTDILFHSIIQYESFSRTLNISRNQPFNAFGDITVFKAVNLKANLTVKAI